jgi:UDP:flavonoid glycosyltransferase YjiC (YdhE family)
VRVLFASTRHAGHFGALLPLARACERAGHEVLMACPVPVDRLPLRTMPSPTAQEAAAIWRPVWPPSAAPSAAHVVGGLFARLYAGTALPAMLETVEAWRPDVVVRESMEFASALAAERFGVPQVRFGIHLDSQADSMLHVLAAPVLDELRPLAGLRPDPEARAIRSSPLFTLAPPSLGGVANGARRFRDTGPADEWIADGPFVFVSFGSETGRSDFFPGVYRAAVEALAGTRVLVALGRDPADLGPVAPSVRVERWVPQAAVLPQAAVAVGHGGSGSTLMALAAGVPQVLLGMFVDGPANAARVAELGAGIALEGGPDGAAQVGDAVRAVLADPGYRRAAGEVAAEIRALPPIDDAVPDLLP